MVRGLTQKTAKEDHAEMAIKFKRVNIWRGGVCKEVDVAYRNYFPRMDRADNSRRQKPQAAKLELSAVDREVKNAG